MKKKRNFCLEICEGVRNVTMWKCNKFEFEGFTLINVAINENK